jgi:hypothetical protein
VTLGRAILGQFLHQGVLPGVVNDAGRCGGLELGGLVGVHGAPGRHQCRAELAAGFGEFTGRLFHAFDLCQGRVG